MKALLLILLLPLVAAAQHVHKPIPQAAVAVKDDRGRPASTVLEPGESVDHAKMHALPLGTGASPDGGAWLQVFEAGEYRILNAAINRDASGKPRLLVPNQVYRISPHKGPLVWVKPDGQRGVVPPENLIAINPEHLLRSRELGPAQRVNR